MTTRRGRSAAMASAMWNHSPDRVPRRRPAPAPARLRSWQGGPPASTSTPGTVSQSTRVMSPRLGTSGWLCASTADAPGSFSQNQAGRPPSTARMAAVKPP
nr:hypothetical protein [Saccharothrix sp.]